MFSLSYKQYHIDHNIKHYEDGFNPTPFNPADIGEMTDFRNAAFSPVVFRQATILENQERFAKKYSNEASKREMKMTQDEYIKFRISKQVKGGYRAYKNVIGLESSGYIDIDAPDITKEGILPTQENVCEAMAEEGLLNIVFRSASNNPHKLRLLYRRGFKLYYTGAYDSNTTSWDTTVYYEKPTIIHSTDPTIFKTNKTSMTNVINSVLYQELTYITQILADAGINTSGIDATSSNAHMHSAHCMKPDEAYPQPSMFLNGGAL